MLFLMVSAPWYASATITEQLELRLLLLGTTRVTLAGAVVVTL